MREKAENTVLAYRNFRKKYNISLETLAEAANTSVQYLSALELWQKDLTPRARELLYAAMELVLMKQQRMADVALFDFSGTKDKLFETVQEVQS